jgi:hypothetical protein
VAWAWAWEWDQGDGVACTPKSERISCFVSFLDAGVAVVGVAFTGGAWKSSEKRSFSDDEGTRAGAGAGVGVT